jgi:hypothetical protein
MVAHTQDHHDHCRSQCRDQLKTLWKVVTKAMGWKASRCRHIQISKLFSMETRNHVVMDFLVATEVGKFLPK